MREEEKKHTSPNLKTRHFFRKRWVYPALYLTAAAIILTTVLWFQFNGDDVGNSNNAEELQDTSYNIDDPSVPVNQTVENVAMPVINPDEVVIAKEYYESDASKEKQEAALVYYENTYRENKGIDIAMENGKSFDVVASLSGNVTKSEKDSILGNIVEIEHDNGIVTVYQSLADVQVQEGESVEQGDVIAKAGDNLYNKDAGIHVHFEVRKDGLPLNPLNYIDKPVTSLSESPSSDDKANSSEENTETGDDTGEKSADDQKSNSETSSESPDASISMANA